MLASRRKRTEEEAELVGGALHKPGKTSRSVNRIMLAVARSAPEVLAFTSCAVRKVAARILKHDRRLPFTPSGFPHSPAQDRGRVLHCL